MAHVSISEFRNNLKAVLNQVNEDHEQVLVTRPNGQAVMLVDADDYESLMETVHLLRVPANTTRLLKGVEQYKQSQRKVVDVNTYLD
ncbi:MAG: type II toxin-antitoxin system prevent-host-death family antitoxin [Mariprofundus sp.]|nr:type II toxin-antitoxin system prevent-host-death family antitoxin [Mariprofundus sp.]